MSSTELAAKSAITDVLHRYARAMDRMDAELALSCWHPGGTDDHSPLYSGSAVGFVEWLWPVHAGFLMTRHVVTNILIEVAGNSAGSESYWHVLLRKAVSGALWDLSVQGRYVDSFECIGGIWAMRHRQSLTEWSRIDPVTWVAGDSGAPVTIVPNNPEVVPPRVSRARDDYSYSVIGTR